MKSYYKSGKNKGKRLKVNNKYKVYNKKRRKCQNIKNDSEGGKE